MCAAVFTFALVLMPVAIGVAVFVPFQVVRRTGAERGHVGATWLLALLLGILALGVSLVFGLWLVLVLVPLAALLAPLVTGRRSRATVTVSAVGAAAPAALCAPPLFALAVCWNSV